MTDKQTHANSWIDAWNSHDVDSILAFYDENIQYSTPQAATALGAGVGIVNGKVALREVWRDVLSKNQSLRLQVEEVLQDGNLIAIFFTAQVGAISRYRAVERQTLNEQGLIVEGERAYGIRLF